jgi:NADH-quinone oxidoreductase subunit N
VNTLWSDVIWLVAILTMVLGNVIAVRQRNVKRLLAYSSIAHAGYLSAAFLVPSNQFGGGSAILYYLVAYTLMTMGAFGVVLAVTGDDQEGAYADDIVKFHGLGRTRPGLAALMTIFLLSLAGLPPGMAGLLGKFYVFSAVVKGGYLGLAIVGVLASAISCFYYLRIIVAMYFLEPMEEERLRGVHAGEGLGVPLGSLLGLCATGVLLFGIFPEHIYRRAAIIMNSILGGAL